MELHYTIYADAFFFINFVMDYLVLSFATFIIGCKRSKKSLIRKIVAALVGAGWSVIVIIFCGKIVLLNIITYIITGPFMCFLAIGKCKPRRMLLAIVIVYMTSFLFAGIVYAVSNYTGVGYVFVRSNFFVVIAILVPFFEGIIEAAKESKSGSTDVFRVVLMDSGSKIELNALCDSGNSLYDPVYEKGVNVVGRGVIDKICKKMKGKNYHLLPYNSVGVRNGMIPVVQFDKMIVDYKGQKIELLNPLIGISMNEFAGGKYELLLHQDVIRDR